MTEVMSLYLYLIRSLHSVVSFSRYQDHLQAMLAKEKWKVMSPWYN